jgi:nitrate/nitrite transporter NarK
VRAETRVSLIENASPSDAFAVFSGALKTTLDLSQAQLDTIATIPYLSALLGWLPGRLNDICGPRVAVIVGSLGMAVSLTAYWIVASQLVVFSSPTVALVTIDFAAKLANGGIAAGIFSSIVKNFPGHRGAAAGIAKAWVGLSGGLLTQIYVGLWGAPDNSVDTLDFVLLLAGASVVACVPALFVVVHAVPERPDHALRLRLRGCYTIVVTIAVCESVILKVLVVCILEHVQWGWALNDRRTRG